MKYVVVEPTVSGYWLDPSPYQVALNSITPLLPPGARSYALDASHYDFGSSTCVKDLWFKALQVGPAAEFAQAIFEPHQSKHDLGMTVTYFRPVSIEIVQDGSVGDIHWLGSILLDEVLPDQGLVSHEAFLTGGSLRVVCGDLEVEWV